MLSMYTPFTWGYDVLYIVKIPVKVLPAGTVQRTEVEEPGEITICFDDDAEATVGTFTKAMIFPLNGLDASNTQSQRGRGGGFYCV